MQLLGGHHLRLSAAAAHGAPAEAAWRSICVSFLLSVSVSLSLFSPVLSLHTITGVGVGA